MASWGRLIYDILKTPVLLHKTPAQVFSCELCKVFNNTSFEELLQVAVNNDSE